MHQLALALRVRWRQRCSQQHTQGQPAADMLFLRQIKSKTPASDPILMEDGTFDSARCLTKAMPTDFCAPLCHSGCRPLSSMSQCTKRRAWRRRNLPNEHQAFKPELRNATGQGSQDLSKAHVQSDCVAQTFVAFSPRRQTPLDSSIACSCRRARPDSFSPARDRFDAPHSKFTVSSLELRSRRHFR